MALKGQPEQSSELPKTALAPLEQYVENAPILAQKVLDCWNDISNSELSDIVLADLSGLMDKARRYEAAIKHLENQEKTATLSEEDKREAEQMRLAFAQEYKRLDDLTGSADVLLKQKLEPANEDF